MKILMLSDYFHPHIGGVEKHLEYVSKELMKRGHSVTVLTRRFDEQLPTIDNFKGINIIRFDRDSIGSKYEWFIQNKEVIDNADIVHCHDFGPFIYWYLAFRFKYIDKPTYITFHGYEGFPLNETAIYMRKVAADLTNGNICVGSYIKKWYRTAYNYLTYGGVKQNIEAPQCQKDYLSASFVGRLEKDTGILRYLEAVHILKIRYGIILKMKICGDGSLHQDIINYINENHLNVELFGFQNEPEKYIVDCGIAFTSSYLSMLEAMKNKRYIISVYENELKKDYLECFPEAKEIFDICLSAEEISEKLNAILCDINLMKLKIQNGFKLANAHTWSKVADVYEKLYGII